MVKRAVGVCGCQDFAFCSGRKEEEEKGNSYPPTLSRGSGGSWLLLPVCTRRFSTVSLMQKQRTSLGDEAVFAWESGPICQHGSGEWFPCFSIREKLGKEGNRLGEHSRLRMTVPSSGLVFYIRSH